MAVVGLTAQVIAGCGAGPRSRALGGAGFNVAVAVRAAGGEPRLLTVIGSDLEPFEIALIRCLTSEPFLKIVPGATPRFDFRYGFDEDPPEISSEYGVALALTQHAQQFSCSGTALHVCCRTPLRPSEILHRAFQDSPPTAVTLDFIGPSLLTQTDGISDYTRLVDWIFFNESEYALARAWLVASGFCGKLVVSRGREGAVVMTGGRVVEEAEAPVVTVVDPTGAGDALAGTFLAVLSQGGSIRDALRLGVEAGSLAVTDVGVLALLRKVGYV